MLEASRPIEELSDPVEALSQYIQTKTDYFLATIHMPLKYANEVMSGAKVLPKETGDELYKQSRVILDKFSTYQHALNG